MKGFFWGFFTGTMLCGIICPILCVFVKENQSKYKEQFLNYDLGGLRGNVIQTCLALCGKGNCTLNLITYYSSKKCRIRGF